MTADRERWYGSSSGHPRPPQDAAPRRPGSGLRGVGVRATWDRLSLAEQFRRVVEAAERDGRDIGADLAYIERVVARAERRIARLPDESSAALRERVVDIRREALRARDAECASDDEATSAARLATALWLQADECERRAAEAEAREALTTATAGG